VNSRGCGETLILRGGRDLVRIRDFPAESVWGWRLKARLGDELERQVFVAPDDVVDRPCRLRRRLDPVDAVQQCAQHCRGLKPRQALTGTRVSALAEPEMPVGVAADVERIRVVPFAFIAVADA
jgi:hypothetical protein